MLRLQYRDRIAVVIKTYVVKRFDARGEFADLALPERPQKRYPDLVQIAQHRGRSAKCRDGRITHHFNHALLAFA